MLFRRHISHQPGTVGRVQTVDLDLNQPPHQNPWMSLLEEGGFGIEVEICADVLCAARECRDVAGGRRAVEDDWYLERSIRVV